MSARVPNSFELIVRGFLQNAVFAGPFEVKLSRCALWCLMSMWLNLAETILLHPFWDLGLCVSQLDNAYFGYCKYQYELLYSCLLCTSITSSTPNPSYFVEASTPHPVCAAYMHRSMPKKGYFAGYWVCQKAGRSYTVPLCLSRLLWALKQQSFS